MSKTEIKTNKKIESLSQNSNKISQNLKQSYQSLRINIQPSDDEAINLNKTEESILNEKNFPENIYNNNKNNSMNKTEIINKGLSNDKNILKPEEKIIKNKKTKKEVKFQEPTFVQVIYVESYKKFNEENTSKDPYDPTEKTDKTKLMCSCFIF